MLWFASKGIRDLLGINRYIRDRRGLQDYLGVSLGCISLGITIIL
jgi:hypothetical protein